MNEHENNAIATDELKLQAIAVVDRTMARIELLVKAAIKVAEVHPNITRHQAAPLLEEMERCELFMYGMDDFTKRLPKAVLTTAELAVFRNELERLIRNCGADSPITDITRAITAKHFKERGNARMSIEGQRLQIRRMAVIWLEETQERLAEVLQRYEHVRLSNPNITPDDTSDLTDEIKALEKQELRLQTILVDIKEQTQDTGTIETWDGYLSLLSGESQ